MNNQIAIPFQTLNAPKNQRAAVLKMLIGSNGISERDTVFNGFRTRISELKNEHHLNIRTIRVPFKSQFGRTGNYNKHFLLDADKQDAIKLFEEINK